MKKILSSILLIAILSCLVACGGDYNPTEYKTAFGKIFEYVTSHGNSYDYKTVDLGIDYDGKYTISNTSGDIDICFVSANNTFEEVIVTFPQQYSRNQEYPFSLKTLVSGVYYTMYGTFDQHLSQYSTVGNGLKVSSYRGIDSARTIVQALALKRISCVLDVAQTMLQKCGTNLAAFGLKEYKPLRTSFPEVEWREVDLDATSGNEYLQMRIDKSSGKIIIKSANVNNYEKFENAEVTVSIVDTTTGTYWRSFATIKLDNSGSGKYEETDLYLICKIYNGIVFYDRYCYYSGKYYYGIVKQTEEN